VVGETSLRELSLRRCIRHILGLPRRWGGVLRPSQFLRLRPFSEEQPYRCHGKQSHEDQAVAKPRANRSTGAGRAADWVVLWRSRFHVMGAFGRCCNCTGSARDFQAASFVLGGKARRVIPAGPISWRLLLEAFLDHGTVKLDSAYPLAFSVIVCVLARPPGGVSVT